MQPERQTDASSAVATHTVWRQLAIVCASDFAVWLGSAAIFPYLPIFLKDEAGASLGLIGLVAGAYFVGVFAFSTLMGNLSDRVGRKPMMVFGTLLYAVATALFFTTDHAVWFMVFRLIEGIGAAAVVPAGQALIAEITTDKTRSRAYGWLTTAQFGGMIVGPALAWPLYELGGGGRNGFYTIFAFAIVLVLATAVVLVLFLREPSHERKAAMVAGDEASELSRVLHGDRAGEVKRRPRLKVLLSRPVLAIVLIVATAEFAVGAWEVVWSLWLREIGAPFAYIGITWVAFSVPMLFSFAAGMAADRYNRFALMTGGFVVLGIGFLSFTFTRDLTPLPCADGRARRRVRRSPAGQTGPARAGEPTALARNGAGHRADCDAALGSDRDADGAAALPGLRWRCVRRERRRGPGRPRRGRSGVTQGVALRAR